MTSSKYNWHILKVSGYNLTLQVWLDDKKQMVYPTARQKGTVRVFIDDYVVELTNLNSHHTQKITHIAVDPKRNVVMVKVHGQIWQIKEFKVLSKKVSSNETTN